MVCGSQPLCENPDKCPYPDCLTSSCNKCTVYKANDNADERLNTLDHDAEKLSNDDYKACGFVGVNPQSCKPVVPPTGQ
jgi:hypothetical protein